MSSIGLNLALMMTLTSRTMYNLSIFWQQLDNQTGVFRRVRYDAASPCDLYLGLKMPENQRLLAIRLPKTLAKGIGNVPAFRGIRVEKVVDPDDNTRFFLNLALTDPQLADVFDVLLSDLIDQLLPVSNPSDVVRMFLNQLARWEDLFGNYKADGLSPEQQKGLFGELYLLRKLLHNTPDSEWAVEKWVGNDAAVQDFRGATWAIEVKTSSQTTHERLTINGERQLDESPLDRLFLYYLNVDVRSGAGESLNDLVTTIRSQISADFSALQSFNRKLTKAGYFNTQAGFYADTGYVIRTQHIFSVTGDFPRIITADLRPGVGDVRYSVSLSDCLPYSISEPELLQTLT